MQRLIKLFCLLVSANAFAQVKEIDLSENAWTFRKINEDVKYAAEVPGTIHTDLFKNGLIQDPFFGDNEKSLQWIGDETWVYESTFQIENNDIAKKNIVIEFDGLDTYAEVFLNDKRIIKADNMFRKWIAKVQGTVKPGVNDLKIVFEPAGKKAEYMAGSIPYTLPGEERVFARKAQYHFGWDWAPRFITCGIWRGARIRMYDLADIDNVQANQKKLNDISAEIEVTVTLRDPAIRDIDFTIDISDSTQRVSYNGRFKTGDTSATILITLNNPVKWWCNGMGKPHMYDLTVLLIKDKEVISEKSIDIGLRTIELIQEPDAKGRSFYFRLNGKPVFIKGANCIPPDVFLPRVKKEDYQKMIDRAVDENMNMLRVWGGGVYENDEFYDECDRRGIMVWQDFMFACAMYPGDNDFINNVSNEVKDQIIRLRNHPSIALWCGNNEIDEGWKNWGWQKTYSYSAGDSATIYNDYLNLFGKVIPSLVEKYDGGRAYHPSSPSTGWGRPESLLSGDVHYWGIWWGMEPFEMYRQKVGRFVSEYGFQGMPVLWSLKKILPQSELTISSEGMKNHQKHSSGFETIKKYMEQYYKVPSSIEDFVYFSQLLQANGVVMAIESHRAARPYCMGTIYWQFNDCWPVISWSGTDYYGMPKALHYAVKSAFRDIILVNELKDGNVITRVVSDKTKDIKAKFTVELADFTGKVILSKEKILNITASSTSRVYTFPLSGLRENSVNANSCLLKFRLEGEVGEILNKYFYFERPKDLVLKEPGIFVEKDGNDAVRITCKKYLAKDVYLYSDDLVFEDNFFDMLPGGSKKIRYTPLNSDYPINMEIKTKTLYDVTR